MVEPLEIVSVGMVNGVGLAAEASAAAIRCALDNFQETRFMDSGGEWIIGSEVPLEQPWRGIEKLSQMAAMAVKDCLWNQESPLSQIPVLLCLAETDRPGRLDGLDERLSQRIQHLLDIKFHADSGVYSEGRVGGVLAFERARHLLVEKNSAQCLIVGVDSYLVGPTIAAYEARFRLLTSQNSDGFVPGEGAAAVLLKRAGSDAHLACHGTGLGTEHATPESGESLRADGLVEAIGHALAATGCTIADTDYRISDVSGEQYLFKESSLAVSRIMRVRKEEYDIMHPADCIGQVGAAMVPTCLAVTYYAQQKRYAPGPTALCHFGNDDGRRAVLIARSVTGSANRSANR